MPSATKVTIVMISRHRWLRFIAGLIGRSLRSFQFSNGLEQNSVSFQVFLDSCLQTLYPILIVMNQTLCIFGRLPSLSLAELESLYGADKLQAVGDHAALLDIEPAQVDFSRLGGTVKFCKVLTVLDTTIWTEIQKFLEKSVPEHASQLPEGKMRLGLSVYGVNVSERQINATGLALKKVIRSSGRSVRVIPNDELALNSAKVLHNQLTGALGWELIFVRDGQKTILAQNIAEQDIQAYAARDQARPKRDSRVGMLPPKLAQVIVNLAAGYVGGLPVSESCAPGSQPHKDQ